MSPFELISRLTATGDAGAHGVLLDLAFDNGWSVDVVPDEWAEYDRVRSAVVAGCVPDERGRPVRCGGLRAVEPDAGRRLRPWMLGRIIVRLWRWRQGGARGRRWEPSQVELRVSRRNRRSACTGAQGSFPETAK